MSHDKSPIEHALDLALFGPLGLVLAAKDALPGWVDEGRHRVVHQVEVAKMVGEHATRHGQKVVTGALVDLGILPGPPPPSPRPHVAPAGGGDGAPRASGSSNGRTVAVPGAGSPAAVIAERPDAAGVAGGTGVAEVAGVSRGTGVSGGSGPTAPESADLAIPGYDSLSASQVVQRLAGLAPPELEAVRSYEAAGRGRRTVLTKISQLQTGRS